MVWSFQQVRRKGELSDSPGLVSQNCITSVHTWKDKRSLPFAARSQADTSHSRGLKGGLLPQCDGVLLQKGHDLTAPHPHPTWKLSSLILVIFSGVLVWRCNLLAIRGLLEVRRGYVFLWNKASQIQSQTPLTVTHDVQIPGYPWPKCIFHTWGTSRNPQLFKPISRGSYTFWSLRITSPSLCGKAQIHVLISFLDLQYLLQ